MKKLLSVAAVAGLMTLAACGGSETTANDSANVATEANAAIYQDPADNAANAEADAMMSNAAVDGNVAGNAM